MQLLIVESPSKAKTIAKYLGAGWTVKASVGHFRDLAKNPDDGLGVDLSTFKPAYEIQNKKIVSQLRQAAKSADEIVLATDPDREGEAIAWHLAEVLRLKRPKRASFSEITPDAVRAGVDSPRALDMSLVAAQEARRVLDRLIGYQVSPRLGRGKTAGRVQSPGLRLVVERERAIAAFRSTSHFGVRATDSQRRFTADWDTQQVLAGDQEYVTDQALVDRIAGATVLTVVEVGERKRNANPPLPFWTSTLQQAASSLLKLGPDETMKAAQGLYEAGLITYLRSDSPHIAESAQEGIREYLRAAGKRVPDDPPRHAAKAGAQEAHECIRPTDISVKGGGKTDNEQQVYRLIRLRTLASQMTAAVYRVTEAAFDANVALDSGAPARFNARGEERIDAGWQDALGTDQDSEDDEQERQQPPLPALSKGDRVSVTCARLDKKTQPPRRYTEATLTKELERRGIGRPSTYAAIVSGMRKREYVHIRARKLHASDKGCQLIDQLCDSGFSFLDYDYTSALEQSLDEVAASARDYFSVVQAGYAQLSSELAGLPDPAPKAQPDKNMPCPKCAAPMRRITGKHGDFWGCSAYPRCKTTLPDENGAPAEAPEPIISEITCPECNSPMLVRSVSKGARKGEQFLGCSDYPRCRKTMPKP